MRGQLLLILLIGIFLIGIVSAESPNVTLLTPTNGSIITSQPISFTANISTFNSTYVLANSTLYIWNSTGAIVYTEYLPVGSRGQAHGVALDSPGDVVANESSGAWINVTAQSIAVNKFTLVNNLNASIVRVYNTSGTVVGSRNISILNNAPLFDDLILTSGVYKIEFTNVSGSWKHWCPTVAPTLPISNTALKWINGSFNGNPQNGGYLCNILAINMTNATGLSPGEITSLSISNVTNPGRYNWNFLAYHNDSSFGWGLQNLSFEIRQLFNNNIFNSSTYETASENLVANITTSGVSAISSVNFIYNGTSYSGTVTSLGGNNYLLSKQLDINTPFGSKNWLYEVIYADGVRVNTTQGTQSVAGINLSICGAAPQDSAYANYTFKNETTSLEVVKASAVATWTYWLGTGAVSKSYSYSNVPTNLSYGFCFSPQNRSINYNLTFNYYNTESPQRTYSISNGVLSNSTTTQILYLLPSSQAALRIFRTVDSAGNIITGASASVYRTIGGSSVLIGTGTTDASGQISFYLDPAQSYDFVFSKTGIGSSSFSLIPSDSQTYNVQLGGGVSNLPTGSLLARNLTYSFTPTNSTLQNNTIYAFSLNVTGYSGINFISINITNGTTQLGYASNAGQGVVSVNVNTGNYSRLFGYYTISTANESLTLSNSWNVDNYYAGDYSLYRQLSLFSNYGFSDFMRIMLAIFAILGIMTLLSINDITDTSESKIMVALLLVWAFSLVGWLDTGLVTTSTQSNIQNLARYSSQYGIAILSSVFAGFLLGRRLFT